MNDNPKGLQKDSRDRRLSMALRDNLRRRKAQERGRAAAKPDRPAESHDSAEIVTEKHKD